MPDRKTLEAIAADGGAHLNGKPKAPAPDASVPRGRRGELTPASEIESKRVRWLVRDRIPRGGLTVVAGEKGLGKSILTNGHLPAQVTRGQLDGELHGTAADVLIITAEDSWEAVIKPRLIAAGADLDRVHRFLVKDKDGEALFTLPDDVPLVEAAVEELQEQGRTVGMLVIDPIGAFLHERTDSHKETHVRRALAPLAKMAERLDVAVPVVMHLTKDESKRLLQRVSGAGAFVNAARSVLGVVRHPDDPDGEQGVERVLVHVASNWGRYAPSLGLTIESRDVRVDDGSVADVGMLVVGGVVDIGVEDVQRGADDDGESIAAAIVAELGSTTRPSLEVKEAVAKRVSCSLKTVERHAMRLRDSGQLVVSQRGEHRPNGSLVHTTTWALEDGLEDGDAERDSPKGTARHAVSVPFGQTRIPEPILPTPAPKGTRTVSQALT